MARPGSMSTPRIGDEIVAAGQFVHTGTRVVLWMDPGGYDAYRVERRFSPLRVQEPRVPCAERFEEAVGPRHGGIVGL